VHRKCEGCAAPAAAIYYTKSDAWLVALPAAAAAAAPLLGSSIQIIRRACYCSACAQHKKRSQGWFITRLMNEVLFGAKPDAKQILAADTRVDIMRAIHILLCARERNVY